MQQMCVCAWMGGGGVVVVKRVSVCVCVNACMCAFIGWGGVVGGLRME